MKGLFLSPAQVGLALGVAAVGCITAFGGGILLGMWYKASEQITPYQAVVSPPVAQTTEPPANPSAGQDAPVTFYSTLTRGDVPYAPLGTPPGAPAKAAATALLKEPVPVAPGSATAATAATPVVATPVTPVAAAAVKAVVVPVAPAVKTTAIPVAPPPLPPVSSDADALPVRQTPETVVTSPSTFTPPKPSAPSEPGTFSVQVGSFRAQEHAERLSKSLLQKGYHAYVSVFAKPGDGSWYRVRVGGFSDRTMANQTAQRLRAQEQLSAVVATD